MAHSDFLSEYLDYTHETECPVIYSRWVAIAGIGALLGRQLSLQHGHFTHYPNHYCMLVGTAGARKDSSINIFKKLLIAAGYHKFSPNKIKPETFLKILGENNVGESEKDLGTVEDFLWKDVSSTPESSEIFVAAGEFNNFIGAGNLDFMSILGELWDFHGEYKNPLISRKSVLIQNPMVSILGGNTPTGIHEAFPTAAIGQGFFSRLLFIYGEPRGKRIAFPEPPNPEQTEWLVSKLKLIREREQGSIKISEGARRVLTELYHNFKGIEDARFDAYNTRRFTHLLKLCIIIYVSRFSGTLILEEQDVIYANTILLFTERYMPKALGEFGKSKYSEVSHRVASIIANSEGVVTLKEIWKHVHADLEKMSTLGEILQNLVQADKIQVVSQVNGFLPKKKILDDSLNKFVDFSLLTAEERQMPL